jgi:hypothetical protein
VVRRLETVRDDYERKRFRLRWERAELERDHPGISDE